MKKNIIFVLFLSFMLFTDIVLADVNGNDILIQMDKNMKAESKYMEEKMVLITPTGQERSRQLAVWNKNSKGSEKMLLKFVSPANIEGTSFLMIGDDMWLYLPALGKTKRIAGSARQGSFMGSDLSYEDMEALGSKGFSIDYDAKLSGVKKHGNRDVYLLELASKNKDVSYSKLKIWVDREMLLPLQIMYYNKEGEKVKCLKTFDHRVIDGRWTAMRLEMENILKESKTILEVKNIKFDQNMDDKMFSTRYLERGN